MKQKSNSLKIFVTLCNSILNKHILAKRDYTDQTFKEFKRTSSSILRIDTMRLGLFALDYNLYL